MNLELILSEKALSVIKDLGFTSQGSKLTCTDLNASIYYESESIVFKNDFVNKFHSIPQSKLSNELVVSALLYIGAITQTKHDELQPLMKDIFYTRWNGSRYLANEMFGKNWEYVGDDNSIKVEGKIFKINDELRFD